MILRHHKRGAAVACVALLLVSAGCNRNPYVSARGPAAWPQQTAQSVPAEPGAAPQVAQLNTLQQQQNALNANNEDLHARLAQAEQREQLKDKQVELLQQQLADAADQLHKEQVARENAESRVREVADSTRFRGGATLTANNSVRSSLQVIDIPGFVVRQDQDVVRIEIPSDRLFVPGTARLHPSAIDILDDVASAISANYPKQRVGIESHTDSSADGSSNHQTGSQQSVAIQDQLTRRNRIPSRQLFVVSHGANHPRASNATAAGRAKNRRIELVIYPETTD